jgi:hypothetical protein
MNQQKKTDVLQEEPLKPVTEHHPDNDNGFENILGSDKGVPGQRGIEISRSGSKHKNIGKGIDEIKEPEVEKPKVKEPPPPKPSR